MCVYCALCGCAVCACLCTCEASSPTKRTKIIFAEHSNQSEWNVVTILCHRCRLFFPPMPNIVSNSCCFGFYSRFVFLFRRWMHAWHGNRLLISYFFLLSGISCFLLFHIIVIVDSILPLGCRVILWVSKIFSNVTHTHTSDSKPKSLLISFYCSLPLSSSQSVCRVLEYRFTNPETTMRLAKLNMKRATTINSNKAIERAEIIFIGIEEIKAIQ